MIFDLPHLISKFHSKWEIEEKDELVKARKALMGATAASWGGGGGGDVDKDDDDRYEDIRRDDDYV